MSDEDFNDRCEDERIEGAINARFARGCMREYGVPYDPYDYGDEEGEEDDDN